MNGTGGEIIITNGTVSEEELLLGRVRITVENNGEEVQVSIKRNTSDNQLYLYAGDNIVYGLQLSEDGKIITVTSRDLGSLSITAAELVLAPVAGSLAAYQVEGLTDFDCILTCQMTDGTRRALTHGGSLIAGYVKQEVSGFADFDFTPSPLVETEPVKPSPVNFAFIDTIPVPASLEMETIEVGYDYEGYNYDDEVGNASFVVMLLAEGVRINENGIVNGDESPVWISIVNYSPDLTFTPSLPWSYGTGGTITLNNGNTVTEAQLIAGKLQFDVSYNGQDVETHVAKDANDNLHLYYGQIALMGLQIQSGGTSVLVTAESSGSIVSAVRLGTRVPVAEVFADEECTKKPVANNEYDALFVKFNKGFGFGEDEDWFIDGFQILHIKAPSEQDPNDKYTVWYNVDWIGEQDKPFAKGDVIEVNSNGLEYKGEATQIGETYI